MAITNLQQARQMYAVGQLVSKTLDGSRPGYRGEGGYQGGPPGNTGQTGNTGNTGGQVDTGDLGTEKANVQANIDANLSSRDRARRDQFKNVPTPTVTIGVDKFGNPINVPTTYTAKRNRQLALDTLNKKGISVFDPRVTKMFNPFDMSLVAQPQTKNPFSLKNIATNVVLGIVAPQLLGTKFTTGMKAYNVAKTLSNLAKNIGLTDKNVVEAFTDSLKSNLTDRVSNLGSGKKSTKSTTTKGTNTFTGGGGDRDGLGSIENMDALNNEYLALLKKFNTGVFSDADQVRFTFLQKILGK